MMVGLALAQGASKGPQEGRRMRQAQADSVQERVNTEMAGVKSAQQVMCKPAS